MSGIGGVVRLDGAPVGYPTTPSLAAAVEHRGRDAKGEWSEESVLLVHSMLWTTSESRREPQPHVAGHLVVVADVRLDNRMALIDALAARTSAGDADIIAAAYARWGGECARRLEGDFAFAVWDRRERTLFCARDPLGIKSFVYAHVPGRLFAFGNEVRVPLSVEGVPREIDEKRIADFLSFYFEDKERTFHRAVRRLPSACTLTLRNAAVRIEEYWSPRNVAPLRLRGGDAEYAEGFREHFVRAVRERMRTADPSELGSMLSGGLDSTSISCVARDERAAAAERPIPVFCWIFSDAMEADEREFQEAVIAAGGMRAFVLDSAKVEATPWPDLDALLPDGPPYAPNLYLNSGAAKAARAAGVRTLLDGMGGDSTISRGRGRLFELFLQGRAFTLSRELKAVSLRRELGESPLRLFLSQAIAPIAPKGLLRLAARLRGRPDDPGLKILHPRIAPLSGALNAKRQWVFTARHEHLNHVESPMIAEGMELIDRVLAHAGVEGRYPFFDRRLVEYCLSLPADQKLADGYSRIVARRAMEGVVPDVVRWRAGKGAPGLHIVTMIRGNPGPIRDGLIDDPSALEPYVNLDVVRQTYHDLVAERPVAHLAVIRMWTAVVLGRWLQSLR